MKQNRGISSVGWLAVVVLFLGALVVLVPAFAGEEFRIQNIFQDGSIVSDEEFSTTPSPESDAMTNQVQNVSPETAVAINDLLENPRAYVGQRISVTGQVERTYTDRVFQLERPQPDFDQLLVVTQSPVPEVGESVADWALFTDQMADITGTMKMLSVVELEQSRDLDFDPEIEAELENVEYYIDATSFRVIQE